MADIIQKLTAARKRKKLYQAEVAKKSGLEQSQISRMETTGTATAETINRVIDALECKIEIIDKD